MTNHPNNTSIQTCTPREQTNLDNPSAGTTRDKEDKTSSPAEEFFTTTAQRRFASLARSRSAIVGFSRVSNVLCIAKVLDKTEYQPVHHSSERRSP
jgi:hypothetical protein